MGGWENVGMVQFQHTAARRRLENRYLALIRSILFQHTAARRRLGRRFRWDKETKSFNTQPPEGGWRAGK